MDGGRIDDRVEAIRLTQLRYVVAAADHGSFRKAADALNVRQSTLSRAIRQLEHATSVNVFNRSASGVIISASGRNVVQLARSVLEQMRAFDAPAEFDADHRRSTLSLGFCTSLSMGGLRASIVEFRSRYPHFQLITKERSRDRLSTTLRSGALDVIITTGKLKSAECTSLTLWNERVLIAIPEHHPLASRDTVYWTDLRGETLLMTQYDPYWEFEDLLTSKLIYSEDRPRVERHDVSRSILKSLISMNFGLGLMLESDAGVRVPSIVFKELRDGTGSATVAFSAYWRQESDNPALSSFIQLLKQRYRPLP
jgi:DNA-binding transcriptional LysR family regulator